MGHGTLSSPSNPSSPNYLIFKVRASFTDKKYLRFNLARNTTNPCPSVMVRVNAIQGEPNFYISNKFVPTQANKMWFFISWATVDAW